MRSCSVLATVLGKKEEEKQCEMKIRPVLSIVYGVGGREIKFKKKNWFALLQTLTNMIIQAHFITQSLRKW